MHFGLGVRTWVMPLSVAGGQPHECRAIMPKMIAPMKMLYARSGHANEHNAVCASGAR